MYFAVKTKYTVDMSSTLVPHVPNPNFWKRYYINQAKGDPNSRVTTSHRFKGSQKGWGVKSKNKKQVTYSVKRTAPSEAANQRAQSQIKRRLQEVGGVKKKRKTAIKAAASSKKGQ